MTCEWCGAATRPGRRGPTPRFCSGRCRVAAHRARGQLPRELVSRATWTRRDGKRPIQCDGSPASSTNAATWAPYLAVLQANAGDGLGIMLGQGLACWDLDHCLDGGAVKPWAVEVLSGINGAIWIERSLSGDGLHVFVHADESPGWRRGGVEFYSRHRFIAVTGDRFPR